MTRATGPAEARRGAALRGVPRDDPGPAHDDRPGILPGCAGAFIGRGPELEALASWLATPDDPVLTVWGPGGIGKTRLVLEALARARAGGTLPGVLFAALEAARHPADVHARLLAAADLTLRPGREGAAQRVADRLARWGGGVIVLDAAEAQATAVAELVAELLAARPDARVLVTSQVVLGLRAERVLRLEGLPVADEGPGGELSHAAALFADRATRVRPGFVVAPVDVADVEQLARRLEGNPLCLEMAATHLGLLDVRGLLARLDEPSTLCLAAADVPARHRSLDALLGWTWALLPPPARHVLGRVSILAGNFDVAGAIAVVGSSEALVTAGLDALRRFALVAVDEVPGLGLRFQIRGLVRAFARAQLPPGEEDAAWRRTAAHYAARFEVLSREHAATGAPHLRQALLLEHEIALGLHAWFTRTGDDEHAASAVVLATGPLIWRGLHEEAIALAERALREHPGASPRIRAALELRRTMALLAHDPDGVDLDELAALARRSLRVGEPVIAVYACRALGVAARHHGEVARALEADLANPALDGSLGPRMRMKAILGLAASRLAGAELEPAAELLEEAIELARAHTDDDALTQGFGLLAELAVRRRELASAEKLLAAPRDGDGAPRAWSVEIRLLHAEVRRAAGDGVGAGRLLEDALARARETSPGWLRARVVLAAAAHAHERGTLAEAAALLDEARLTLSDRAPAPDRARLWAHRAAVFADLDRTDGARTALARAEAISTRDAPLVLAARAHLQLALARQAGVDALPAALAVARHVEAMLGGTGGPGLLGAPLAARILAVAIAATLPAPAPLFAFDPGRARLVLGERAIDLSRRGPIRRIFVALLERAGERPLTIHEAFAAGWPAERASSAAAANRVYNAISTLRSFGLGDVVEGTPSGYTLRPGVPWITTGAPQA